MSALAKVAVTNLRGILSHARELPWRTILALHQVSMAYIEERAVIVAPIDAVFEVISDVRRALSWLEGFTQFELLPGPERGHGARVRAGGTILGFSIDTILEVVEYLPPTRLVSQSTKPIRSQTTWELSETPRGTLVTYTGEYHLPFALRLLGDRAVTDVVSGQTRRSLGNLKRLLESAAPQSQTC